jgi:transcriptional regulator with GAF, ATPase, and Fis domain
MQKIAILYDASQAVLSTFELDEVLQRILMIARDYFHLQNVAILLLDKDKQELHPRCVIGLDPRRARKSRFIRGTFPRIPTTYQRPRALGLNWPSP